MYLKVVIDIGHLHNTYEKKGMKGIILNSKKVEEYDLNLLIAKSLKSILEKEGCEVYFSLPIGKSEPDLLNIRTNYINKIKPDISISIHHDWSKSSNTRGFTIYKWKTNKQTTKIKEQITKEMKKTCIENGLNYNDYSECYPGNQNFALVRKPNCNALLIECGFFSNEKDVELTQKHHWSIAYRIACGVLNKQIEINQDKKETKKEKMQTIIQPTEKVEEITLEERIKLKTNYPKRWIEILNNAENGTLTEKDIRDLRNLKVLIRKLNK